MKLQISPPPPPPWIELPRDVTAKILQKLGAEEILTSAEKVCTTWKNVCLDPGMWRVVRLENLHEEDDDDIDYELMCRCAVDRSQAQLIDLCIADFGDNGLLNYVAHRCSNLRRLTFDDANKVSAFALAEAVKKFPQLEELNLVTLTSPLDEKDVETIGISCPLLKSFSYDEHWADMWLKDCNGGEGVALAIARTMPNLRWRLDRQ